MLQPGTGVLAWLLESDLVTVFLDGLIILEGKSLEPRGSMLILDFQIVTADV